MKMEHEFPKAFFSLGVIRNKSRKTNINLLKPTGYVMHQQV